MSNRGRPRALADEQKRRTVCAMISVGAGIEAAARQVGCSTWTIRREAQRDEDFAQRLREAETASELMPLQMLRKAASTQWRAAAWLLERSCPERFARRKPESIAPEEVKSLLDTVATIMSDECPDVAQQQRMIGRLEQLQQDHFGQTRAAQQGSPQAMSEIEQFINQFGRKHDAA